MKKFSVVFVLFIVIYSRTEANIEDYCWREYDGTIPTDALTVGKDKNGEPIYIAQVLFQDKLLPGKIHDGGKKVYFEFFDLKHPTNLSIKVLSTKQPQKFEWLTSQHGKVTNLSGKVLIKGGHEQTSPTYIGRITKSGETSVGKVMCQKDSCKGLYTSNNGAFKVHKAFEILSYNPQIESKNDNNCNPDPDIDIRMGP